MNRTKTVAVALALLGVVGVLGLAFMWLLAPNLPHAWYMEYRYQDDPFVLGQYFFNHGDQADGTYDIEKAQRYFKEAVDQDDGSNELLWHQYGRTYFLYGQFDTAIEQFEKQIELHGDALPNVYYMLGLTYAYKARQTYSVLDWQAAEQAFKTYLTFDPMSPWARTDLSWIYFAQGKYEPMKELLETGLVYEPSNPWLLNMYGLALYNTGEQDKALQYFVWAKNNAATLTVEEWGQSYPGNDPAAWPQGLAEFRAAIDANVRLASGS